MRKIKFPQLLHGYMIKPTYFNKFNIIAIQRNPEQNSNSMKIKNLELFICKNGDKIKVKSLKFFNSDSFIKNCRSCQDYEKTLVKLKDIIILKKGN